MTLFVTDSAVKPHINLISLIGLKLIRTVVNDLVSN